MIKKQLIDLVNQKHKGDLNSRNTSFSNINKSKKVWWFNVPLVKFKEDVNLLLNTDSKAYWICLPKGFVSNISSVFRIRQDKDAVDLEISADRHFRYLHDLKSSGTGFDFCGYVKKEIKL